jgi:hypothetical protein
MYHHLWVLLELDQIKRPGSGNVSLPRMLPGPEYRPVEYNATYHYKVSAVTGELLLAVFSEPDNALAHVNVLLLNGESVRVVDVSTRELLHRVFRGDKNGPCVLDPVSVVEVLDDPASRYEIVPVSTTIGDLIGEED